MRVRDDLRELLGEERLDSLAAAPEVVLALDGELRIALVNDAYERGGVEAGGPDFLERWGLGPRYTDAITHARLRDLYGQALGSAAREARSFGRDYACPNPGAHRRMHLHAQPLPGGGLLLTHVLIEAAPARPATTPPDLSLYRTPEGLLRQCAECRRTARAGDAERWDWVAALLEPREDVSHGLCPVCLTAYQLG